MSADETAGVTGHDRGAGSLTTIPPELVLDLHRGLYAELTMACEDAPQATSGPETRTGWILTLRRMAAALDALDVMGWHEPTGEQPVTISLPPVVVKVFERQVEHDHWLSEQANELAEGRSRAAEHVATVERFLASLSERPALMIPVAAFPLVRECVHEGIPMVSEAIDRGVDLRECGRRLNALAELLDLIGWSDDEAPAEDVDATEHAGTVKEVAPAILETLTTAVRELSDGDAEKPKNEGELRLLSGLYAQARKVLGE